MVQFFGLAKVSIPVSQIADALLAAEGKGQTRETTRDYILVVHGHGSKQGGSGLGSAQIGQQTNILNVVLRVVVVVWMMSSKFARLGEEGRSTGAQEKQL